MPGCRPPKRTEAPSVPTSVSVVQACWVGVLAAPPLQGDPRADTLGGDDLISPPLDLRTYDTCSYVSCAGPCAGSASAHCSARRETWRQQGAHGSSPSHHRAISTRIRGQESCQPPPPPLCVQRCGACCRSRGVRWLPMPPPSHSPHLHSPRHSSHCTHAPRSPPSPARNPQPTFRTDATTRRSRAPASHLGPPEQRAPPCTGRGPLRSPRLTRPLGAPGPRSTCSQQYGREKGWLRRAGQAPPDWGLW